MRPQWSPCTVGLVSEVTEDQLKIESISAITLFVADMRRSVLFYEKLGFRRRYGGAEAEFTSFDAGSGFVNLMLRRSGPVSGDWGRVILYVSDVDAMYQLALEEGLSPEAPPRDAEWQERYFHLADPDGHELSFARPLDTA